MIKNNIVLIILFLMTQVSFAEEATINCMLGVGETVGKNNQTLIGCEAAIIALKSDPQADIEYRKKLNKKLANRLALQTQQILQDLAGASSFYEDNNQPFFVGKENDIGVAKSCKFDFLKNLEKNGCDGKLKDEEKEKIAMLSEAIGEGGKYKPKSLYEGIAHTYGINKYGLGLSDADANQCPLSDSFFPAGALLTSRTVKKIFEELKATSEEKVDHQAIFQSYPQLSLIFHADKSSPEFLSTFEDYIKKFQGPESAQKEYLLNFFFQEKNKRILAKGVSNRCKQVQVNVTSFICGSFKDISVTDPKTAKKLFDDYNIKKEFQDQKKEIRDNPSSYRTYGYMCEAKARNGSRDTLSSMALNSQSDSKPNSCVELKNENDNIDNWYNCFDQDIKKERSKENDKSDILSFCSKWSCQDDSVKKAKSCQNGGPLSSADLASLNLNDDSIESQIAYLKTIEKRKSEREKYLALISSGEPVSEEARSALGLSEFDLNAFGAETVMKFVGLPSTPVTLALVTQDMHDKGIKPSTPEEIREVITRGQSAGTKVATSSNNDEATTTVAATPVVSTASFANNWKNTNYIKPDASPIAKTKHKIVEAPTKRNPEVEQMMDDLQEIMKAGKGTSSDDGDDSVDTSTSFSGGAAASSNKKQGKTIQGLTSSDLETWAQKLKAKETSLNFRETLADQRDAEYWRNKALNEGGEKEKGRSAASVSDEKDSQGRSPASGSSTLSSDSGKGKSKAELAAEVSASSTGLIVTPEKLDKLEKMDLKNFGVNIEEPFVISVRMSGKLIHVRVAKVEMKGREFLAPRLTDDNKEAKEVILSSPLFKEFRYFYEKENSAYFPVKSVSN